MSSKRVKVDDLSKEIAKIFEEYGDATRESVYEATTKVAKECKEELNKANPAGSGKYGSWAEYNKNWAVKDEPWSKKNNKVKKVVHNKKKYRLAHLLEHGHALKHGGRTVGDAAAFKHIKNAEEKAVKNYEKYLKENIAKQ